MELEPDENISITFFICSGLLSILLGVILLAMIINGFKTLPLIIEGLNEYNLKGKLPSDYKLSALTSGKYSRLFNICAIAYCVC